MINEIDTIFHVYKTESTKTLPHITSGEYIKGGDMFFISLDNNTKKLVTLKHNKYFNLLREQYIGNLIEDNQIKNILYYIVIIIVKQKNYLQEIHLDF